jgi:hypothetical protein
MAAREINRLQCHHVGASIRGEVFHGVLDAASHTAHNVRARVGSPSQYNASVASTTPTLSIRSNRRAWQAGRHHDLMMEMRMQPAAEDEQAKHFTEPPPVCVSVCVCVFVCQCV